LCQIVDIRNTHEYVRHTKPRLVTCPSVRGLAILMARSLHKTYSSVMSRPITSLKYVKILHSVVMDLSQAQSVNKVKSISQKVKVNG
jgi:hypothetical protein